MQNSFDFDLKKTLKALEERIEELEVQNAIFSQILADINRKPDYMDSILRSKEGLHTSEIAADYGIYPNELFQILCEEKLLSAGNVPGTYQIRNEILVQGLVKQGAGIRWNQKGRLAIHEILKKRGIQAIMDRESDT